MSLLDPIEKGVLFFFSLLPSKKPPQKKLDLTQIVAHRGFCSDPKKRENTLPAFKQAQKDKVWGIEFDIRWTKDGVPVVFHDPSTQRVFPKTKIFIHQTFLADLNRQCPEILTLESLIKELGGDLHLMIEIKEPLHSSPARLKHFKFLLQHLTPICDFHILSLQPEWIEPLEKEFPLETFLLVATTNTKKMAQIALKKKYAGLAGHFLLLNRKIQKKLESQGQKVGVGFIDSKNLFYREVARDPEWIFCNQSPK